MTQCNSTEQRRLLRAFLKALLAQCGDSDLPENPPAIHTDQVPREVSRHMSPALKDLSPAEELIFWTSRSLNADKLCPWLGCLGFNLAVTLVAGTIAGPRGRTIVGQWFKYVAKRGPSDGAVSGESVMCFEGPGLYQMLYPRLRAKSEIEPLSRRYLHQDNALCLYRSRAWVFLDDARLFKAHRDGPHFPADDITFPAIQFHDIIGPSHDYGESHDVEDSEGFSLEIEMKNLSKLKAGAAAIYVDLLRKQRHWVGFAEVKPKKARNYKENRLTQVLDSETIGDADTPRKYWEAVLDRYPIQAGATS
ncbi:hypothetical protein O1611_g8829 [Lasiodiplodia mahajangana]|uniref:Uncharacterized protein n=1 Tax=Lasiodiplodia mahajangana TaxID=1108764 RepID=A0ACC2JBI0_9PEZI|nr:hypothetical protein O1611_g8829 [Lasiodiplodia mahajangana]